MNYFTYSFELNYFKISILGYLAAVFHAYIVTIMCLFPEPMSCRFNTYAAELH